MTQSIRNVPGIGPGTGRPLSRGRPRSPPDRPPAQEWSGVEELWCGWCRGGGPLRGVVCRKRCEGVGLMVEDEGVQGLEEVCTTLAGHNDVHRAPQTPVTSWCHGKRASGSMGVGGVFQLPNSSCNASWVGEYSFHWHITFPARCQTLCLPVCLYSFGSGCRSDHREQRCMGLHVLITWFCFLLR